MATGGQIMSSEEAFDYICTSCSQQEHLVEAKRFCVECGEYFCSTCLSFHQRFSATKAHTLINCEEVSKGHIPARLSRCDIHTDKEEDMVCCDHNVVCCRVCITQYHSSCQNIDYLPRLAQKYKEDEKRVEIDKDMRVKIQEIKTIQKDYTHRVIKLKTRTVADLKELEVLKKSITECVNNVITNAEKDIKKQFEPEICIMQGHIRRYNELLSELNRLSIALSNENDDIGECKKVLECKRKLNEIQINSCGFDDKIAIYEQVQHEIIKAIDRCLMKGERLYNAAEHVEIPDLYVKEDDSVFISDFYNYKIRRVDSGLNMFESFDVEDNIWGICEISKHELAFTLPSSKKVQFISTNENPVIETKFQTNIHCRGIAYCNRRIYLTGDGMRGQENGQLQVFDLKGKLMRNISKDLAGKYFTIPRSIIVDTKSIYITDEQNGIICLDLEGKRKWVYNKSKCKFPWGICFTQNGNLLVAGRDSNNIVIVSKDGEFIGELLNTHDGLKKPKALSMKTRNRIVVSEDNNPHLKVFHISDCKV